MEVKRNLDAILADVQKLSRHKQIILLQKISHLIISQTGISDEVQLTDISGIGSFLWNNVDIENYVREQRQW